MRRTILALAMLAATIGAAAQTDYKNYRMAGPYEVVARDGEFRSSKGGSERDMWAAWECAKGGFDTKALEIINAYAEKLQRFDGHDAPLCLIQAYWLCRAMALEHDHRTPAWDAMIRRAMLPTMNKFEADSPYANGNWGAIVNRCRMAAAICMADTALYNAAVDYYLHANDNGALPHYVSPTGQCQETGRDQSHAHLGLGALCDLCEMAEEQGDDLWGALDNRLMHGIEYSARYNLGFDVPFETWTDCTGLYNDWTEPGAMGRGTIRDIYEKPYKHYAGKKHLKMPYTRQVLALQKKAAKNGELQVNPEANHFKVKGVTEGKKLHQVFTYAAPEGAPLKHDYDVYVQPRGSKEWTHIDTYMAKVNAPIPAASADGMGNTSGTGRRVTEISYCMFDFTGDVFVRVVTKNRRFQSARIRPDYRGTIANVQNDSTVQFLLFQPENVSVEFSFTPDPSLKDQGNIYSITDNLLVFTSRPPMTKDEAEAQAKKEGRQFVYIPPGYHTGNKSVGSETTVYLAGGAYLEGTLGIENAHNVSILGRGIARPSRGYEGCHVYRSRNVLIDGLVVSTCPVGGSDGVTLHDVRSISHPQWGDGLNVFASSNVLYDRVFCRNSDDCTTVYATRKGFEGSARNIRMRNSTLWADVAHPIFVGLHGAAAGPHPERLDTIENVTYENIDILCQSEPQVDYQGCLAINAGDNNLVRNVTFDNIRIEELHQGCILQVKVAFNSKYCAAPGRGVEGVTFRNIRYYGRQPYLSIINGYDAERKIKGITFEGLKINGRAIYDKMPGKPGWYATADLVPIFVGNHVEGVTFKK